MLTIDLRGNLAVITGASGMLGRVMARTFADCGADLVLHYFRNKEAADLLAGELRRKTGRRVMTVQADITSEEDVARMKNDVIAKFGVPDILVHNAVVQYERKSVLEQPLADFKSQFDSCVMQTVLMTKAFVPEMIARGNGGRIVVINTESIRSRRAGRSPKTTAAIIPRRSRITKRPCRSDAAEQMKKSRRCVHFLHLRSHPSRPVPIFRFRAAE